MVCESSSRKDAGTGNLGHSRVVVAELLHPRVLERVATDLALAGTFQEAMESNHQAGLLDHSGSWRSRHALNPFDHCKIPGLFQIILSLTYA